MAQTSHYYKLQMHKLSYDLSTYKESELLTQTNTSQNTTNNCSKHSGQQYSKHPTKGKHPNPKQQPQTECKNTLNPKPETTIWTRNQSTTHSYQQKASNNKFIKHSEHLPYKQSNKNKNTYQKYTIIQTENRPDRYNPLKNRI